MKFIKKGLAVLLAVMLVQPSIPTTAAQLQTSEVSEESEASAAIPTSDMPDENISAEMPQEEEWAPADAVSGQDGDTEGSTDSKESSEEKQIDMQEASDDESTGSQLLTAQEPPVTEPVSKDEIADKGESSGTDSPESTVVQEENSEEKGTATEADGKEPSAEETETEETTEEETVTEETEEELKETEPSEEIRFNTGDCTFRVVSREDFFDRELGDACFEEDGSYTINIPEENPFFPYEVQFTYDGGVTEEWFMTPDDSVEIGGHTFYVSAYFDGTQVTQMSLKVGDDTVIVYPKEKEFTEGGGIMLMSLLPLEEKALTVDLRGYTPAELTMVSLDSIFTGENALTDTDKVVWSYESEDNYTISSSGDLVDLSCDTYYGRTNTWQMIVGSADQLDASNIRYLVDVRVTGSRSWLKPTVYTQDSGGKRSSVNVSSYSYYDYELDFRELELRLSSDGYDASAQTYLNLEVDGSVFSSLDYAQLKVYEGKFSSAQEAVAATEITGQIVGQNMAETNAGYLLKMGQYRSQWLTIVTFDAAGNATGCLPFYLYVYASGDYFNMGMYDKAEGDRESVRYSYSSQSGSENDSTLTAELYKGYSASGTYYVQLSYYKDGNHNTSDIAAAYVGSYASKAEAESAGAEDIKKALFNLEYTDTGYGADYSQGVTFTVIVNDDAEAQKVYHVTIAAKEGTQEKYSSLNNGTNGWFRGLKDRNGRTVASYVVDVREDSYAEFNYLTILVDKDTDLTGLAPVFTMDKGMKLYTAGSSTEEVSGESVHDFSNGPVQYSASAENGTDSKNYWLQVVRATEGAGWLYINSMADSDAATRTENGITYSTREIVLDSYHDDIHDILLANMGTEPISNLAVELSSDTVELDSYWTLSGNYDLSGFSTVTANTGYGELPNLAKIRLRAKEGAEDASEISGTLTIKDGSAVLMVLTLTGVVGDPGIVTKDIPQAVKYVPYGTMIQNNNKYKWNQVSYELVNGSLPAGMIVKPNGEIYGVPTQTGEFSFTVLMRNSYGSFSSKARTYTLVVIENTDANVDAATDQGYDLTQRVPDVKADLSESHTLVSTGVYGEFVDVYIDGEKLEEGTDYSSESGSTRITIWSQALVGSRAAGTHTIGVEFRTQDTDILKRAAQNYVIEGNGGDSSENGGDSGSGSGSSDSGASSADSGTAAGANSTPNTVASAIASAGVAGILDNPLTGIAGAQEGNAAISHVVSQGDSLWKIAEKYYGSGTYWQKIYEDNAAVISDPNKIFVGQVLLIYPISNGTIAEQNSENITYYTVEAGDSLWKIAVKFYGKSWRWRKIYEANDSITNPERIYEGQVIIIPD